MIDTQRTLAYDQLFLCWRLPQDSSPAWHYSVEYRRRGVVPGGGARGGIRGGLAGARWGWQRLEEVSGSSAVIDRLEMDSVYVLRVRGCNKAGFGEYSEEVYLHTPPAPGKYFTPNTTLISTELKFSFTVLWNLWKAVYGLYSQIHFNWFYFSWLIVKIIFDYCSLLHL